ncbi:uncharacterized protein PAF06_016604 [Gastrophryne carolinensis]
MDNQKPSKIEITVTGAADKTRVTLKSDKIKFYKELQIPKWETIRIPFPAEIGWQPIVIKSDSDISVTSRSSKGSSGDTSLMWPLHLWGDDYYIITPEGPQGQYKEFIVLTHALVAIINIQITGTVTMDGQEYKKGDVIKIKTVPYQTLLFQSQENISGTRVFATSPVTIIAGHTCAQDRNGCSPVFEQLIPISNWGIEYYVPYLSFQPKFDTALVMSAKKTTITYTSGTQKLTKDLEPGELFEINVDKTSPLSITCPERIQVLLHGKGGTFSNTPFGSFLTLVPDTTKHGLKFSLTCQENFNNLAVIIARTDKSSEITFDGTRPQGLDWKLFPGTKYSWTEFNFGTKYGTHTIEHPNVAFGVINIGYTDKGAYGSLPSCIIGGGIPGVTWKIEDTPGTPGTPGESGTWHMPGTLGYPATPGGTITWKTEEIPGSPGTPGIIIHWKTQKIPGSPGIPGKIITWKTEEIPGSPGIPGKNITWKTEETPGAPGMPGTILIWKTEYIPGTPGVPGTTRTWQVPNIPGVPGIPGKSGTWQMPGIPGYPAIPGGTITWKTEEIPGSPGTPGIIIHWKTQKIPGSPGIPGKIITWKTEEIPGSPGIPGKNITWKTEETPGAPGMPGTILIWKTEYIPGTPGVPGTTRTWQVPNIPGVPGIPGKSGTWQMPGIPGYPAIPGGTITWKTEEIPGSPGTPGIIIHWKTQKIPGSPGIPGKIITWKTEEIPGSPGIPGKNITWKTEETPGAPGMPGTILIWKTEYIPGTPGVPGTTKTWQLPNIPGVPGIPGKSGTWQMPGIPGYPAIPGGTITWKTEEIPGSPGTPGIIIHWKTQKIPGSPGIPGKIITWKTEEIPGSPGIPGKNITWKTEETPGAPGMPGTILIWKTEYIPGTPGVPGTTKTWQVPNIPGVPGIPGESGTWQMPGIPGIPGKPGQTGVIQVPGIPGTPSIPGQTGVIEMPGKPGTPSIPGQTGVIQMPGIPGTPSIPGQTGVIEMPGKPGTPSIPGQTVVIQMPGKPGTPSIPGQTGIIQMPGIPGTPSIPGQTGGIQMPGRPGTPSIPGQTVVIQMPGKPGTPSIPGQTGVIQMPGKPGTPSIPGQTGGIQMPGIPGTPSIPGQTGVIQMPGIPGTPSIPGQTGVIQMPGKPGTPSIPGQTVVIQMPGKPGTPSIPGQTGVIQMPGKPGTPSIPGQTGGIQMPGIPGTPSIPGQTVVIQMPGKPGTPSIPGQTGVIQMPGIPGTPSIPGQTGGIQMPGIPGTPSIPGQTVVIQMPGKPGTPSIPGQTGVIQMPGIPGTPSIPGQTGGIQMPGIPGTPSIPGQTGGIQMPGRPGTPSIPGQTGGIQMPGIPGTPSIPGQTGGIQMPGIPGTPSIPGQTGGIQMPGIPGTPSIPGQSGTWIFPGFPGFPGIPGQSGTWKFPGFPGFPGIPGESGTWKFPGFPGFPGIPGQSGTWKFPGFPGFPGIPGQSGTWKFPGIPEMPGGWPQHPGGLPGTGTTPQQIPFPPGFPGTRGTTAGKVFIVTFLQNKNSADKIPTREVMITGIEPVTQVTLTIEKDNFKKVITVKKGETITFPYPVTVELKVTGYCRRPMVITADKHITVVSRNYRDDSGDTALIYPVSQWGLKYYITTPSKGPANEKTQFSITSQQNPATVIIYITGEVILNKQQYKRGDKITITLDPYTTLQIQSPDDLSGTMVESNEPVQVMAGHTCAQGSERCSHVCDQLQDVENWGTTFFIPSMPYQPTYDIVYVIVSIDTTITYSTAKGKIDKSMKPGEQIQINVDQSSPLFITCKDGIQVLFFGRGGRYNNQPFGPFTSMIPSSETFGLSYSLFGQNGFDVNLAFIICQTVSISGITIDGVAPQGLQWKPFPGTAYSYTIYDIGKGLRTHTVQHAFATFGLLSFGYTRNIAYGSMAPCIRGNPYWWTWGRWLYYIFQRPVQYMWRWEGIPTGVSWQQIGFPSQVTSGKEFAIAFLPDNDNKEPSKREILVTGAADKTMVSVICDKANFKKEVKVLKAETVKIPIPKEISIHPVVIKSDFDITVISRSFTSTSGDIALTLPFSLWGTDYYVITPSLGPQTRYKQVSIFSYSYATIVNFYVKGFVVHEGKPYKTGDIIMVNMGPYQTMVLQSETDMSGSRVVTSSPAGVVVGFTCSKMDFGCSQSFEQLIPVTRWGTEYFMPPSSFQTKFDTALVMAAMKTTIKYTSGKVKLQKDVEAGELLQINIDKSSPLTISSPQRILVLFFGREGSFKGKPFGPFLSLVPDTTTFGTKYNVISQERYNNLAIIIARTISISGITIDGARPKGIEWRNFPEIGYSWGEYNFGFTYATHFVQHPTDGFGLISIGYGDKAAYGSMAPCTLGASASPFNREWVIKTQILPGQTKDIEWITRSIDYMGERRMFPGQTRLRVNIQIKQFQKSPLQRNNSCIFSAFKWLLCSEPEIYQDF